MIDTKKYEGHTPGPWKVVSSPEHIHAKRIFHNNTYIGSVSNSDKSMKDMEPDARLIADAPMLLASLITAEARIKELEEMGLSLPTCENCGQESCKGCNSKTLSNWNARSALKGKE